MHGESFRTIIVYVDSYEDRVPSGRFFIAASKNEQPFYSLNQLLLTINRILDRGNFPQSFHELRAFQPMSATTDPPQAVSTSKNGAIATFSIRILFRQNATWQGSITWTEGNQEVSFRSVLELIFLVENALNLTQSL